MADQAPEKTPVKRIIEVDRKLAAQLYDVWVDMKQRIEKDIKQPTQVSKETQQQQHEKKDPAS